MMGSSQRPANPTPAEHVVQFFDDAESLAIGAAAFISEGLHTGEPGLVVAREANLRRIVQELDRLGVDDAARARHLLTYDAHALLARFTRNGVPDPELFEQAVVPVVERLGARRRIYGEMVDILAEEGNFLGVYQLEMLWTTLGERMPFTLLCGYGSAHFAAPTAGGRLRHVCALHQRVERHDHDLLANWLLENQLAN
jgi:hypothetical protein